MEPGTGPAGAALRTDINELVRAYEALMNEMAQLRAVYDSIETIIVVLDPTNYEVLYVNEYARKIYGNPKTGGLCYEQFYGFEKPCDFCNNDEILMQKDKPHERELHNPRLKSDFVVTNRIIRWPDGRDAKLAVFSDITERKKWEKALRDSEERYRELVEISNDIVYRTDAEGVFTFVNKATSRITGYSEEEFIGRHYTNLILPDYRAASQKFYGRQFTRKTPNTYYELPLKTKTGEVMWVGQNVHLLIRNRKVVGFQAIARDITRGKTAEKALEESEQRYRRLFEDAPLMYVITHRQEGVPVITDCNQLFLNSLGYLRQEVQGKPLLDFYSQKSRSAFEQRCADRLYANGESFIGERDLLTRDGKVIQTLLYTAPELDLTGIVTGKRSMFVDITERKRAEDALRESEARFRSIFESATECIYIQNKELKYTHVNPAVANLFGIPASEIIGKGPSDLYGQEIGKQIMDINARVLRGERIEHEQVRMVGGTPVSFRDVRVPLQDSEGRIVGVCCLARYSAKSFIKDRVLGIPAEEYPSPAMQNTLKLAAAAARSRGIVLLCGESGSGKDHLARWIHDQSEYASGPFLSVNCAALPRDLAESELFGHERGAFTGATVQKKGQLELAEGGTILLNEIGELDLVLQAKLLAFLDTSSFLRVGGQKQVHVSARLIAATHRDLNREVSEGRFLSPLFFRLGVLTIEVPPLRERLEDLPVLVREIMKKVALKTQLTAIPHIDQKHLSMLSKYSWPGNVRELRNVIERSLILWEGGRLSLSIDWEKAAAKNTGIRVRYALGKSLREAHQEVTAYFIEETLRHCEGDKTKAAYLLGISRDAFYRYIKKINRQS